MAQSWVGADWPCLPSVKSKGNTVPGAALTREQSKETGPERPRYPDTGVCQGLHSRRKRPAGYDFDFFKRTASCSTHDGKQEPTKMLHRRKNQPDARLQS